MDCLLAQHVGVGAFPLFGVFFVALALLVIVPIKILISCMIFHKAGYSWALGLLMLVPIANIILIFVLAFGDWPVRRELRQFKQVR
ncbi:MAG: hypothetical protein P8Z79_19000 [Sedimentisphaerales bacterium]|jgi:hypothetical protein